MVTATISRTFDIDIATMWSLWTDPEHLARWFRPSLVEFGPTVAAMDLRAGGSYRIEMVRRDGGVHAVTGHILEVDEPDRLSYTWQWDGADNASLVQITFTDEAGKTAVSIRHSRLIDDDDVARHTEGWAGCLDCLARTN